MRNARILKSKSRTRFRGGGFRGRGGGNGNWQVALLVVFCAVGVTSLGYMLYTLNKAEIENWRDIRRYSAFLLVVTLFLMIPAVVLLSLNTAPAVGILAIVSLCLLITPILIWIPIAVRKSRHFDRRNHEREMTDASAESVYTANADEVDRRPYPAYNFLPQASKATYSTPVSVAPQEPTSEQTKPSAPV